MYSSYFRQKPCGHCGKPTLYRDGDGWECLTCGNKEYDSPAPNTYKVTVDTTVDGTKILANGCWAWSDCFSCPFPDCCIDNPDTVRRFWQRHEAIRLVLTGINQKQIAETLKVCSRTIHMRLKGD